MAFVVPSVAAGWNVPLPGASGTGNVSLREWVDVADWAPEADWNPAREARTHVPMRPQAVIAFILLLVVLFVAGLTGSWIAWIAALASAAWVVWVAADTVMRQIVDRPLDSDRARGVKR